MPRKTITANVSLPPEIHAWVKAKIAAILEAEPAANPTFTSVVSEALRRAMRDEERAAELMEAPDSDPQPAVKSTKVNYKQPRQGRKKSNA